VIFVGVRDDLWQDMFNGKLHPKPKNYTVSLDDAFRGLPFTDSDRLETDISKYAVYRELVKLRKGGQSSKYFQLTKANPKKYSGCITATTGNKGAASVKHWDNRAFTVAEVKRIMSIPDDYCLTGTYQQKVERLGRMVPPLMMSAVAANIYKLGVIGANTN
jgi:DNA (cytosine-5)-methyltransferase 1